MKVLNVRARGYFILIFMYLLTGCAEEQEYKKIKLAADIEKTETVEEDITPREEQLIDQVLSSNLMEKPTIFLLPIQCEVEDNYAFIESEITRIAHFLLSQNDLVNVYPVGRFRKLIDKSNGVVDSEMLSKLLQTETVNYYIKSGFSQHDDRFLLHYTVYDAQSHASMLEQTSFSQSLDDVIRDLQEMASKIIDTFAPTPEKEYPRLQMNYNAVNYFVRGEEAAQLLDFQRALDLYAKSLNEDAALAKAYVNSVSLYFQHFTGVFHSAAEPFLRNAFKNIDKLAEKERMLLSAYNNYYFRKYEEALSIFLMFAERYPETPDGIIGTAKILLLLKQPEAAKSALDNAQYLYANNVPILRILSEAYNELGEFEKAQEMIEKYRNLTNNSTISLLDEAHLLSSWGREKESLEVLKQILSGDPESFEALVLNSQIFFEQMDFQKSIESYRRAIDVLPPDRQGRTRELYEHLFLSYVFSGKYNAAVNVAKNLIDNGYGISNFKSIMQVTSYISLLDQALGKESNLIHAISSLIEIQVPDVQLARLLTLISAQSDDEKYLKIYEKVSQKVEKTNRYHYRVLQDLYDGYQSWHGERYEDSRDLLTSVMEYEYNSIVSYYLCRTHIELGDFDNAEKEIERFYANLVLEEFENAYILPYFHIAQAELFEKKGQKSVSNQMYHNVIRMWEFADIQLSPYQIAMNKVTSQSSN